jgi:hypothetical protein
MVSRESGGASDGAAKADGGGGLCESVPDDAEDEETAAVRAWAREWARRLPRWSDEQWRYINAGLGYRARTRRSGENRDSP